MEFDKNSTSKLAKLARLSLNDEQLDSLEKDLTSIVSFIDQLKEINTEKIDPSLPRPEDQPERVFGIKHPNTSYKFLVICYDRFSGEKRWQRIANELIPHEGHHRDNNFASASPTTDGKRLYCWFGSAGLYLL